MKRNFGLDVPGKLTATGWKLPARLSEDEWVAAGFCLGKIENALQWWLGDWWAYGEHRYGDRKALFEPGELLQDMSFQTVMNYGWVAKAVTTSVRTEVLTFQHHLFVAHLPPAQQRIWLQRAVEGTNGKRWSSNDLKAHMQRQAALDRTRRIDLDAEALGKFAVLYADPPWQYEFAPMGGDATRAIERHYPTMELEAICALPVSNVAHYDSVLFLWVTSPKLHAGMRVLDAWGFEQRTTMVWVKDRIGMGYYVREKHEILVIAKRGELPPPVPDARPDSVIEAPRLEHSAKPPDYYDAIDRMYPGVRKIELFGRGPAREGWTSWGNQAEEQADGR